jgi:hypothetical protein
MPSGEVQVMPVRMEQLGYPRRIFLKFDTGGAFIKLCRKNQNLVKIWLKISDTVPAGFSNAVHPDVLYKYN